MVVVRMRLLFFAARIVLLTSLAYLCALSVNSVIATNLALPPASLQTDHQLPRSSPPPPPSLSTYAIIATRDIFNSVKAASPSGDTMLAVTTANIANLKLLGTATGLRDRAFAIFEDQTTHNQLLYREGEAISPGVQLIQV